jgi:hypothetical protein
MAGELITENWQIEMNGLLHGPGTDLKLRRGYPHGVGASAKTNDTNLGHADGAYAGPDYVAAKTITSAFYIPSRAADPWATLNAIEAAWAPTSIDEEFHLQLPAPWGHRFVVGRPRSLEYDFELGSLDHIEILAKFDALNPVWQTYVPPGP